MMSRRTKQVFISVLYLAFFGLVAFWVYGAFFKAAGTCSDGIRNQNETAIDCGGTCGACQELLPAVDMQITESAVVYGGPGRSDVLIRLFNPNDRYGSAEFSYTVKLVDAQGAVVAQKTDTSFILPKETKYVMQIGMETQAIVAGVEVSLDHVDWQVFSGYRESPVLNIGHKRYGPVSSGVGFGQVDGTLSNESGYDFQKLLVKVVLRDAGGKPIAINQTEMRTVVAFERRDFRLIWPLYFDGEVNSVEAEAEADVYHSDNFIKQYVPTGTSTLSR